MVIFHSYVSLPEGMSRIVQWKLELDDVGFFSAWNDVFLPNHGTMGSSKI